MIIALMALLAQKENKMPSYTGALKRLNLTVACVLGSGAVMIFMGCRPSETTAIRVEDAWARPVRLIPEGSGGATTAVYMTLINEGRRIDRLIGASTESAERVEMHRSALDERQVMRMRPVREVSLEPGETVRFEPGSYHFMLVGLKEDLVNGRSFSMTLSFEKEGERTVTVSVRAGGM